MHDTLGVYKGVWFPQMDRCWISDDGFSVCSRIVITEWGKVEHATIQRTSGGENDWSCNGERDIPWAVKQEIKNELFGENRVAIEVFPEEKSKVDVMDVYHLWVFVKGFRLPFGIHPFRDPQCRVVSRGCPKDPTALIRNYLEFERGNKNGKTDC